MLCRGLQVRLHCVHILAHTGFMAAIEPLPTGVLQRICAVLGDTADGLLLLEDLRGLARQLQFAFKLPDPGTRLRELGTLTATNTGAFTEVDFVLGDPAIHRRFRDPKLLRDLTRPARPPARHNSTTRRRNSGEYDLGMNAPFRNHAAILSQTRSITRGPDQLSRDPRRSIAVSRALLPICCRRESWVAGGKALGCVLL